MRRVPYRLASAGPQQPRKKVERVDPIVRLDPAEFANTAYDISDLRQREYVAEVLERFVLLVRPSRAHLGPKS